MHPVREITLAPTCSMRDAMAANDRGGLGIVLIVDSEGQLLGTLSDGDIRRAILDGMSLESPASALLARKTGTTYERPVVAHLDSSSDERLQRMRSRQVDQLPIVDKQNRVLGLVTIDQFADAVDLPVQAVIMAGGFGRRLSPLTDETPKPMLPIAGQPLLERTIKHLRQAGIRQINVTTHYLPERIIEYFGSGQKLDVSLNYVSEDEPLGTAGSLRMLDESRDPMLVINGDIFTRIDFRSLVKFHRRQNAELTMGVRQYGVQVPYGVVTEQRGQVVELQEKPTINFLVNAGIYLIEASARPLLPPTGRFDMTDLIAALLREKRVVASFPIVEYWLDIGHHDDLTRAQLDAKKINLAA